MGRDVSGLSSNSITSNEAASDDDTTTATSHQSPTLSEVKPTDEEHRIATTDENNSVTEKSPEEKQDAVQGSSTKTADSEAKADSKPIIPQKPSIKKLSSTVLATFLPGDGSDAARVPTETKEKASVEVRESIFGARKVFNRKPSAIARSSDEKKDTVPNTPDQSKPNSPVKVNNDQAKETEPSDKKLNVADEAIDQPKDSDSNAVNQNLNDQVKGVDLVTCESSHEKVNLEAEGNEEMKDVDEDNHESSVLATDGNDQMKEMSLDIDKKMNLVAKGSDATEDSVSDKKLNSAAKTNDQTKETGLETHKPSDKKLNIVAKTNDQTKDSVPDIHKLSDKKLNAAAKTNDQTKDIVPDIHKSSDKKLSSAVKTNDQKKDTVSDKKLNSTAKTNDQTKDTASDKKLNSVAKVNDQSKVMVPDKKLNSPVKANDQAKVMVPDKKLNSAAKANDQTKDMVPDKKLNAAAAKRSDQMKDAALENHKMSDKKLMNSSSAKGNDMTTMMMMKDIRAAETQFDGNESVDSGGSSSVDTSIFNYPCRSKKSQEFHQVPRKFQHEYRRHDEDNCSVASSTASSSRANKFKTTVPVAPTFRCVERLEKRKEFYSKLEDKHHALEAEKMEYEARIKEEEKKMIKQLRKTMVFKANPVPSFYREGPPPRTELKKLPVTRPKSPKLTRRKSCGDASEDKGVSPRRNSHNEKSPKTLKQTAKTTTTTPHHKVAEQQSADISVNG